MGVSGLSVFSVSSAVKIPSTVGISVGISVGGSVAAWSTDIEEVTSCGVSVTGVGSGGGGGGGNAGLAFP